ncbi:biotin--[acetyl-CoA-carboxylase] ligase [Comamonas composti]|uniref:biotin--[acetyl-CoA-carboxylase] ligase n=1 Tax=Comamonas composti TaxID=408558 RepID=UPI0003FB6EE6|nr:biotin--[acetyl-CoA-carboxylase] ligase [Comamonas composti]
MRVDTSIHWPAESLWQAVEPLLPGFSVEILPSLDSTNTELMRRARQGLCDPVLLVTELQTAGRGRLGRQWTSGAGDSLTFSLGLPLTPGDWSGLSLAVGLSVAQSLQPRLPEPGSGRPRIGLKWPNDLWIDGDRKLGGILIETASFVGGSHDTGSGRYVVIGIGLNIRSRPGEGMRTPPASLLDMDERLDAPTALACVLPPLVADIQSFARQGFAPLLERFAQRDILRDRAVTLSDGRHGQAQGLGTDGALLVRTATGVEAVTSSEISVRPSAQ